MLKNKFLKNRFLVPIGRDNRLYFSLLEKYKNYIGGIYIGWPGTPSGRESIAPSRNFFDQVFRWCLKNGKVFDILFNMEPHDFKKSLEWDRLNLIKYKHDLTELTFSSVILMKKRIFNGFKKNISINVKINTIQQIYAMKKDNPDINAVVLDRDINRDKETLNSLVEYSKELGMSPDILINEGCVPFCPNKKDHNAFVTLSYLSDQKESVGKAMEICSEVFEKNPAGLLKSPFLTREALPHYSARFFKLCDRTMHPGMLHDILNYYVYGKKIDIGIAFAVKKVFTGITTDMLPTSFHRRIVSCKNECYRCSACEVDYEQIAGKLQKQELQRSVKMPIEVMIEAESRCNFNCQHCFNRNSFAKEKRGDKNLSTGLIKQIIDGIARSGIGIVRFTGGEPLLRKDIFQLFKYAKAKKLEVRLNTNGSKITAENARKMKGLVDNILISMGGSDNKKESLAARYPDILEKKIKAVKLLKKEKIPIVRIGTVITKESVLDFERMAKIIKCLPVDAWDWYRPISNPKKKIRISKKDIESLVEKIISFKKETEVPVSIANALPFCAISDSDKIDSTSIGALYDDGHSRLVVDPRGFLKPNYFMEENIGNPLNILGAWNSTFMKKMRNLKFLPVICEKCTYKLKCRGGSRHEAMMAFGKYGAPDPLADPKNIIKMK